jgi:hypothetical protein
VDLEPAPTARNRTIARIQQPPAILLELLADARGRGLDFEQAWPASVAVALSSVRGNERSNWRAAFAGTRDGWECAWNRWPGTRRVRAPLAVAHDPGREPIGLRCPACDAPVEQPAHGRRKVYCSRACQRAAHGRKLAAA